MTRKIRFTAEGPIGRYDEVEKWLTEGGYILSNVDLVQKGGTGKGKGIKHNHYKKPAMELVFDALNGNKGMAMGLDTLTKAMNMPQGTISGSLAKLKKAGRVKNDGKGRWAAK